MFVLIFVQMAWRSSLQPQMFVIRVSTPAPIFLLDDAVAIFFQNQEARKEHHRNYSLGPDSNRRTQREIFCRKILEVTFLTNLSLTKLLPVSKNPQEMLSVTESRSNLR